MTYPPGTLADVGSINVLLVDDHELIRAGLQQLLASHERIQIIAQADNSKQAYQIYTRIQPDIVIMDLSMPAEDGQQENASMQSGIDAIQRILTFDATAKVIVLTAYESDVCSTHLLQTGVKGYLTKRCAPRELVDAVLAVFTGGEYFSATIPKELGCPAEPANPLAVLTNRERQVFTLLVSGLSASAIAKSMCLSPKTVHAHRSNILRKLKLKSTANLIHLAMQLGMIQS